eukprot:CAMPEP_0177687774 /NCGR_PEP_ID=MMETSP0447-20121125/34316_1 /TAXON_ID=0 /ORGANISM="Stygamoeba regulata, Strain BSH-02190019" /LENGTH=104 /DNA_ID=CAMNT_0019198055 /DNA_START=205 /DNA_END=519 /DNA_ORIENTATION=+
MSTRERQLSMSTKEKELSDKAQYDINRIDSDKRWILNMAPDWVPDEKVQACQRCAKPFSFTNRRHHCRCCGKVVCDDCSKSRIPLPQYGFLDPVRACSNCAKNK